jgi:hypothetical protein
MIISDSNLSQNWDYLDIKYHIILKIIHNFIIWFSKTNQKKLRICLMFAGYSIVTHFTK